MLVRSLARLALIAALPLPLVAQSSARPVLPADAVRLAAVSADPAAFTLERTDRLWDRLGGKRVRFVDLADRNGVPVEGWLVDARADTMFVGTAGGGEAVAVVPHRSLMVEEWRRSDPSTVLGIVGLVLGGALGGVIAHAVNEPPVAKHGCTQNFRDVWAAVGCSIGASLANDLDAAADEVGATFLGVLVGSVAGALGGRALGASMATEGWRPVPAARLRIRPRPRGEVEIGFTVPR